MSGKQPLKRPRLGKMQTWVKVNDTSVQLVLEDFDNIIQMFTDVARTTTTNLVVKHMGVVQKFSSKVPLHTTEDTPLHFTAEVGKYAVPFKARCMEYVNELIIPLSS